MTRLSFIPAQAIKVAHDQRSDLAQYVAACIYIAPDSSAGVPRAWVVNADDTDAREIPIDLSGIGKADSVSVKVLANGSVRLLVSAAQPGQSGSTAQPVSIVVPNVFPPAPPLSACIDQPARNQANAATNMAHAAQIDADALEVRMAQVEAAVAALDG
jgi:hypothetical protein